MRTPPHPELAEAMRLARERFDDGSDAYADADLLDGLMAGIEAHLDGPGSVRGDLVAMLRATTSTGAQIAASLTGDDVPPVVERIASVQILASAAGASRDLLESIDRAPHDDAAFMPDDERAAAAAQVEHVRRDGEAARERAARLHAFLMTLVGEFEAAGTATAARVAARIRGELDR